MKARLMLLFTIAPWLFYGAGNLFGHRGWGAVLAIAAMLGVCLVGHKFKGPDWTQLVFFILILVGVAWLRIPWMTRLQPALAPALFTMLAFGSLAIGRPFTEAYARETTNPRLWDDPAFEAHFMRVNRLLTLAWGAAFALALGCAAWRLTHPFTALWPLRGISSLGFLAALLLTRYFPFWYQRNIYERERNALMEAA
jgi:hypothetical protein